MNRIFEPSSAGNRDVFDIHDAAFNLFTLDQGVVFERGRCLARDFMREQVILSRTALT